MTEAILEKKILAITGAGGFIGRLLVVAALQRGWRVRALLRRPDKLSDVRHPRLEAWAWDLREGARHRDALKDVVAICHLAAYVPPGFGEVAHVKACYETNVVGTTQLLQAAVDVGIQQVIHLAAGNAYQPGTRPAQEKDALYPCQKAVYYLTSKVAADTIVEHFRQTYEVPFVNLRPSAVYGPGMKATGFLPTCLRKLKSGEGLDLTHDGAYRVDWVYAGDVVAAALTALERRAAGAYNIGSGEGVTLLEVARTAADVLGVTHDLIRLHPSQAGEPVPVGFRPLDITKAADELDFRPVPLAMGITAVNTWMTA